MSFEYTTRSIRTPALQLDYFLVPWDTEILGVPVAQISELRVIDPAAAARDYEEFAQLVRAGAHRAVLVSRARGARRGFDVPRGARLPLRSS